jgi:predicted RNA-binding protein with TRAM domain
MGYHYQRSARETAPVEVGKEYQGYIVGTSRGDGVSKIRGFVIFVADAGLGQHVRFRITNVTQRYATAVRLYPYGGRWGTKLEVEKWKREDFLKKRQEEIERKKREEEKFEKERLEKGLVEYAGRWGTPEQVKQWKQEDFEKEQLAKGMVKYKGEWMTREELFEREQLSKGLVKYEGEWVTPEEKSKLEKGLVRYGERWGTLEQVEKWRQNDFEREQIAKGLVKYEGEWITKEELFKREQISKGLVKYKDEWKKPKDVEEVKKLLKLLKKKSIKVIVWLRAQEGDLWDIIERNLCHGYEGYITSLICLDILWAHTSKLLEATMDLHTKQKQTVIRYMKSLRNLMKSYRMNIGPCPFPPINEGKLRKMYSYLPECFLASLFGAEKLPVYKSAEDLPATLELAGMTFYMAVDQIRARVQELDEKYWGFVPLSTLEEITKKPALKIDEMLSKAGFQRLNPLGSKTDLALVAYRLYLSNLVEIWLDPKIKSFENLREEEKQRRKRMQVEDLQRQRETFQRY